MLALVELYGFDLTRDFGRNVDDDTRFETAFAPEAPICSCHEENRTSMIVPLKVVSEQKSMFKH